MPRSCRYVTRYWYKYDAATPRTRAKGAHGERMRLRTAIWNSGDVIQVGCWRSRGSVAERLVFDLDVWIYKCIFSWWTETRLIRSHPQQRQEGWRVGVSASPPRHGGRDSIPSHCRSLHRSKTLQKRARGGRNVFSVLQPPPPYDLVALKTFGFHNRPKSEFVVRCLVKPRCGGRSCQEP